MTQTDGRHRSIRWYLALLAVVSALPLVALLVRSRTAAYRAEVATATFEAERLAEVVSAGTIQLLADARGTLEGGAARREALLRDEASCREVLVQTRGAAPYLTNILFADVGGRMRCSIRPVPEGVEVPVTERDWFLAVRGGAPFTVGRPVVGTITGDWVVALSVAVRGPGGELEGVMASSLPLTRFQELLAGVEIGADELVTVADGNRTILVRSQDPGEWVGRPLPPDTTSSSQVAPGRYRAGGPDLAGVERSWANITIPEVGWTVFAGIPTERVRGPALAALRQDILLGLLILTLTAFLAWRVQRMIADPLRGLVGWTRQAGREESPPVPMAGPAEVHALATQLQETFQARTQAERAERSAKERYRSILDQAVFGITSIDEDGRFLQVNPALAAMLRHESTDTVMAIPLEGLFQEADGWQAVKDRLDASGIVRDVEARWRRSDGTPVTVRLNGRRIDPDDAHPGDEPDDGAPRPAYQMIVEDITGQKELEKALRHSQKMEAVGRLAGGVAHDFNNLLTVISGNTELLMASLPADDPGRTDLDEIQMATARATSLTRQLLAFSRKGPDTRRSVQVNALLERLEVIVARLIGGHITVRTRYEEMEHTVWADPSQLEQAIVNICVNARDAMPDGGTLTLDTSWVRDPDDPTIPRRAFGWVRVRVEDTGVGMPPDVRDRIFEPFFTTKPSGKGTGLGLATSYANIDSMGGLLTVWSEEGTGTRFDLWLPAEEGEGAPELEPGPAEARISGTETVLVAEDEASVRRFVTRTLESAGYTVLAAEDGAAGAELFREREAAIDLVLTDIIMPRRSGTELAAEVRRLRPDTPVLFMSGYVADLPVQEALGDDPEGLLRKPFTIPELLGRVRMVLDRARAGG